MRFDQLEGLRAILAWTVVVWHAAGLSRIDIYAVGGPLIPTFFLNGTIAVTVFMILSGFVISHLVITVREPYHIFITRRFLRLWPAHAAALAIFVVYSALLNSKTLAIAYYFATTRLRDCLPELAMVRGVVPIEWAPLGNINPPDWSISLEWQFYLVAPFIILAIYQSRRIPIAVVAVFAAMLLLGLPQRWTPAVGLPELTFPFNGFLGVQFKFFIVGILSYLALRHGLLGVLRDWRWAVVAVFVAMGFGQSWIEASALAIWAIVLTALAAPGWRLNSFLASRPLRWLGQISYSTYITHFLVLIAIKRDFLGDANEGKFSFFLAILGLGTVTIILVSMAMYKFVEEPANRWARNWGRRRMAHLERRAAARQKDTTRSSDFPPHPPSNSEAASGA